MGLLLQAPASRTERLIGRGFACLAVIVFLLSIPAPPAAAQKQKLDKSYQEWLDRDAAYVITKEERTAFLKLATDDARDQFIQNFWELRNPTPGSEENTFKDEVYRRIAYANANFGGYGSEGWRTDRGRTYITLGPPQQKEVHYNAANLFPIEIWFYSYNHPSLPPYFYIMFYRHEGFGDFRFYSPFVDGPDKLVPGTESINDRQGAIQEIQDSVGPLVARLSQSLIPNEPIDPGADRPSLQSDTMLATIKGLADNPFTKQELDRRRASVENVKARLLIPGQNLEVATLPLRDSRGVTRLDYAIRFRQPSDASLKPQADGRYAFNLEAQVRVFDSAKNELIFTQEKKIDDLVDKDQFNDLKDMRVGYEGSLPLPPGKFHLEFVFTDWEQKKALQADKDVVIPEIGSNGVVIAGVLPFSSVKPVDPASADVTPFTLAGLRFLPLGTNPLNLVPGRPMQLAYQIWAPPQDPAKYADQKMTVEYAVGRPAIAGSAIKVSEDIAKDQFDPTGSLVGGKKLPLDGQPPGSYIMSLSITQPGTPQAAYWTLPFSLSSAAATDDVWDLTDPSLAKDAANGIDDNERALCLMDMGKMDEARPWFRRALDRNHADEISRSRLVDAYYARKDYAAVLSLFSDAGITNQSDPQTILQIAESFNQTGAIHSAISLLETALRSHPENGPLYLALAEYYRKIGNLKRASELETEGRTYLASPPSQ